MKYSPHDADLYLPQFTGYAPLFPLPNGMLLPELVLPLYVFEERYREMTADVLAGDRLLALALLRPGWEEVYQTKRAPVYSTVCLGRVTSDEKLEDGCYNITVQGLCRAEIIGEQATGLPYRVAHLRPLKDIYPSQSPRCWQECREALVAAFHHRFPQLDNIDDLQRAVRDELSPGVLCDLLCSSLPLSPSESAEMLKETDVRRRCRWLLHRIKGWEQPTTDGTDFQPEFSVN